jgi:hypothetical protein
MRNRDQLEILIDGGLGNQLFKFYAGLYFSEKWNLEPIFETSRLSQIAKLHPGENIETLGLLCGYSTRSTDSPYGRYLRLRIQDAFSRRLAHFKLNSLNQFQ